MKKMMNKLTALAAFAFAALFGLNAQAATINVGTQSFTDTKSAMKAALGTAGGTTVDFTTFAYEKADMDTSSEEVSFNTTGTWLLTNGNGALFNYEVQLNSGKSADVAAVMNIESAHLTAGKVNLYTNAKMTIKDSTVDFDNFQMGSSYLGVKKNGVLTIDNSTVGSKSAGHSGYANFFGPSTTIYGTMAVTNSTFYACVDQTANGYALNICGNGKFLAKDSTINMATVDIGRDFAAKYFYGTDSESTTASMVLDHVQVCNTQYQGDPTGDRTDGVIIGLDTARAGTLTLKNGSTLDLTGVNNKHNIKVNALGSIAIDATSKIKCASITNSGTITIDMTGATEDTVTLIDASAASTYGTYALAAGKANGYKLAVVDNDLVAEKVPDFYVDAENAKLYHITSAEGLKQFRDICNTNSVIGPTYVFNGKTIVLDDDIDLGNEDFETIRSGLNNDFTFDGQGHTIANFKVTGDQGVALFGEASRDVIQNLTVSNATIVGVHWVAAIIGYGECSKCFNCKVYNCTVTAYVAKNAKGEDDDGDKVGAICGYLCNDGGSGVATNCYIEGCTIQGYRDVGGAFGMANGPASITNVTVKNTTVINDQSVNYKGYKTDAEYDIGAIIGETDGTANVSGLAYENVTIQKLHYVARVGTVGYNDLNAALNAAKDAGKVCDLLKDVDLTDVAWTPVAGFNGTFNGKGYTITGLTVTGTGDLGLFASTSGATIKDLTIDGATVGTTADTTGKNVGVLVGAAGTSTITGVTVKNATIASVAQYVGGIAGTSSSTITSCQILGTADAAITIAGKDQVGGICGYQWCNGINDCTVSYCAVTATEERAGCLVGKLQCSDGNDSFFSMNGNAIANSSATAPDYAGGLAAQIMGDMANYEIKNNTIDATLTAPATNPIGTLRADQNAAFTGALAKNITGNSWTDATLAADSFQYTNVASGVDAQTITRANAKTYVAQIGETKYESLAAAIAAVPTAGETATTIQMIADEAMAAETKILIGNRNIVLDLNGKTISGTGDATKEYHFIELGTGSTLTVDDTSANADGSIVFTGSPYDSGYGVESCTIYSCGGVLTLKNGLVKNATAGGLAYAINTSCNAWANPIVSTFIMEGGKVSAPTGDAALRIYQNAYEQVSVNNVTIKGGEIVDTGIFVDAFSYEGHDNANTMVTVDITGGTINGLIDCKMRNDKLAFTISGGTFTNAKLRIRKADGSVVTTFSAPVFTIEGGTFAFVSSDYAFGLAYDWGENSWDAGTEPYSVTGGTFNVDPSAHVATGYVATKSGDVWMVGVKVDTGDQEGDNKATLVTKPSETAAKTTELPQEVATAVAEQVTIGGKTTTVAAQIEQTTKVEGVKLTTTATTNIVEEVEVVTKAGVQAVVDAAKTQAETDENATFTEKIATAKTVEVKVEVTVTPTVYVAPMAEQTVGTMAFKLEPKATVKIIEDNVVAATQVVDVEDAMIDKTQPITVSIFTGFNPVQIIHRDNDGNFIEAFEGDDIAYDATTGIATVAIDHFSTLTAYEAAIDPLQPEGSTKVVDGFYQNAAKYENATEFYITNLNGLKYFRDFVNGVRDDYVGNYATWDRTNNPFQGKNVNLLTDIDLGNEEWTPVGVGYVDTKRQFHGTFDAQNHVISNLKVTGYYAESSKTYAVGLFGRVNGTAFSNVVLSNVTLKAWEYAGALFGQAAKAVTITNCTVCGAIDYQVYRFAGGLVGHTSGNATIADCKVAATGTIDGNCSPSSYQLGGLIGTANASPTITRCEVSGITLISNKGPLGGIAGDFGYGTVSTCRVANVTITATNTTSTLGYIVGRRQDATPTGYSVIFDNTVVDTTMTAAGVAKYTQFGAVYTGSVEPIVGQNIVYDADGKVIAGTFEVIPAAVIADGYEAVAQGTMPETYVVQESARTIEVTPATVQAALDSAKKGDTIVLTEGDYGVLYLRNNGTTANRIFENVTICVNAGDAVTVEQIAYSPVSGKSLDIENLTIDGITFDNPEKSAVLFDVNGGYLRVNGLTVQNCTKVGNNSQGTTYDNAMFLGCYYDGTTEMNATFNGDTSLTRGYHNIKVLNNAITNVYQPIRFPNSGPLYGLTVSGNTFTGCDMNNIMLSSKTTGDVIITDNEIVNMSGRFLRASDTQSGAVFTVTNNTVTTPVAYDEDGSIFKVTGTAGFTVTEKDNNWTAGSFNDAKTTWISNGDTSLLPVAQVTVGSTVTKYSDLHAALEAAKADGALCELLSNVDLTGVNWTPVSGFQGDFDGKGYTISGLNVNVTTEGAGLFASASEGIIKNFTLDQPIVVGTANNVGAVCGGGFRETISNVTVNAAQVTGTGSAYVGGIVGGAYCTVLDSKVLNSTISGKDQVGGVIGYICGANVTGCTATGNTVTATSERAGGLVGKINIQDSGTQYFNGNVISGTIKAPDYVGGIAAQFMGGDDDYEIKNNDINVTFGKPDGAATDPETSPIAVLRPDRTDNALTQAITNNITGNWWEDATSEANSYTFTSATITAEKNYTVYRGVAMIGDTCYKTLPLAIAAANAVTDGSAQTITLLADCETSDVYQEKNMLVLSASNVTLDLNEKTLTTLGNYSFTIGGDYDKVINGTVKSGPNAAKTTKINSYAIVIASKDAGTKVTGVVFENVTTVGGVAAGCDPGDKLTCAGGCQLTLRNCDVTSGDFHCVIEQGGGDVIIESGSYNGCGPYSTAVCKSTGTFTLKGGIYSSIGTGVVAADGYEIVDNTDASTKDAYPYAVVQSAVAQVGETKYATLAAAVEAAKTAGVDTVTLLADCTIDTEVVVGTNKTATAITTIEGTNSVAGGYYTITVKDGGKLAWDYLNTNVKITLNANLVDETTAGNGLWVRGRYSYRPTIAGSVTAGGDEKFTYVDFLGDVAVSAISSTTTFSSCYFYGKLTTGAISTFVTCYGPVKADTIAAGKYMASATLTVDSISGGMFYNMDQRDYLTGKLANGYVMLYYKTYSGAYITASLQGNIGVTDLHEDGTITYFASMDYAVSAYETNDVMTMVKTYYSTVELPDTVTLVVSNSLGYASNKVNPCDGHHKIVATADGDCTNYVNLALGPDTAAAYLVHDDVTGYYNSVSAAMTDAVAGDKVYLNAACAEAVSIKQGVTFYLNGMEMTGTVKAANADETVELDAENGSYTTRLRTAGDSDAVATVDYTSDGQLHYFASLKDAVGALANGTTATLLKDISMSQADCSGYSYMLVYTLNAGKTIDGGGHTVTYTGANSPYAVYYDRGTIKNITFAGMRNAIAYRSYNGATFDHVKISGTASVQNNFGAFVIYPYNDLSVAMTNTFRDCEMAMDIKAGGGYQNMNAAFVGVMSSSAPGAVLNFERCIATGNIICGMAALFYANPCYKVITINATDCYNEGIQQSMYVASDYVWNPVSAYGCDGSAWQTTLNLTTNGVTKTYTGFNDFKKDEVFGALKRNNGAFLHGPLDATLALALNDQGGFAITTATDEDAARYHISVGLYSSLKTGGSSFVDVNEDIYTTSNGVMVLPNLMNYRFVDSDWVKANPTAVAGTCCGYTTYTLGDETFYYIAPGTLGRWVRGEPTAADVFSVSAFDAAGNLLAAAQLSDGVYTLVAGVSNATESVTYLYDTLEAAMKNVNQDGTVTVLADNSESFTAAPKSGVTAFTVDNTADYDITGTITTAEGYEFKDNDDGTWSFQQVTYVAQIGSTKYTTIQAAVNAAQANDTITMIADVACDDSAAICMVPYGKTITLDLAGKTIASTGSYVKSFDLFNVCGNLTLTDSSDGKTGAMSLTGDTNLGSDHPVNIIWVGNGGTLTVAGGTYTISMPKYGYAEYIICASNNNGDSDLIVNGGTFVGSNVDALIRLHDQEKRACHLNVTINGGDFTLNGSQCDSVVWLDVQTSGTNDSACALTVTGGNFTSNSTSPVFDIGHVGEATGLDVKISGGQFKGNGSVLNTRMLSDDAIAQIKLSGGIYSGNTYYNTDTKTAVSLNNICASGYEVTDNTAEATKVAYPYTVQEAPEYVCQNTTTGTKYTDLATAIAAATSGDTIQMIDDVDIVFDTATYITIKSGKSVTLDLNGKVIVSATTYTSTSQLIFLEGGNLTITDTAAKDAEGNFTGMIVHGANPTWIYEGGDDYSGSYASDVIMQRYSSTLTVNGGRIENISTGSAAYAIDLSADSTSASKTTNLIVNDGEIVAVKTAIRIYDGYGSDGGSDVTVNGGYIYGVGYAGIFIHSPSGESAGPAKCDFKVTNGTIKGGSYAFYDYTHGQFLTNHNYTISGGLFDGYIWSYGANLNISGGEFTDDAEIYKNGYGVNTIEVSGGYFDDYFAVYAKNGASDADIKVVSGGFYVNKELSNGWNLSDYVATGYQVVANTDAETKATYPWTVAEIPTPAARIVIGSTTNEYYTLAEAITNVTEGQTIVLLRNNKESFEVEKNCTFFIDNTGNYALTGKVSVNSTNYDFILTKTGCKFTKMNTITFAFFDPEPAKTEQTTLPDPMTVYAEQSWDLPVLATTTYDSENYTFVGWTDEHDSGDVIKEFGAGLATNSVTLYAKFSAIAIPTDKASGGKIQVQAKEGTETATKEIKVTKEWVIANVDENKLDDEGNAPAADVNAALEQTDANGLKKWQNYVLGIENETNKLGEVIAQVSSDAAQVDDVNKIPVVPAVYPKADTGFTVKYELNDVSGDTPVNVISATNIEALVIDVNSVVSNKKFKVNVVLTADGSLTGEKIASTNTIGVLKTAAASKQSLISVPWESFGATNEVSVAGIVKTANLTAGDMIYVYDEDLETYFKWRLASDKKWTAVKQTVDDEPAWEEADKYFVTRGSAIWIERADTSTPVCFYGQAVEVEGAKSEIAKGSTKNPSWNLVASPSTEDLALTDAKLTATGDGKLNPTTGDEIQVPTATTPVTYKFRKPTGADKSAAACWCYQHTEVDEGVMRTTWKAVTEEMKLSAGQGFWYLNKGEAAKTIEW